MAGAFETSPRNGRDSGWKILIGRHLGAEQKRKGSLMGLRRFARRGPSAALAGIAMVLLSAGLATAQATRPAVPGPATRAAAVSVRPVPGSTRPATNPSDKFTLNFKDAPLESVLDYFSAIGGFSVIKEGPVDGRVTLESKQPVTRQEAVALLDAALKANGFAAIQLERTLKIMPRDKAKKNAIPVHFGADPADIRNTDELITQVIPIRNVDANKLKEDLKPLIDSQQADVTANEASNTLVITDTSANVRRIATIIYAMDQQEGTTTEMRIVQLHYANASNAVKLIETIFKPETGGAPGPQQGQQMVMGPNGPQPPPGAGGSPRRSKGHVIAAADDRTNIVVVTGPSDSLKTVDDILKKLDSNPMPAALMKAFPLKYADAEAASKLVTSIFQAKDQDTYPFRIFFFGGGGNDQSSKVKVNATFDERTNTLIVTAPSEILKQVEDLIRTLDASPVAASGIHIFPLKYADSYSAAKLINNVFNPAPSDSGRVSERVYIFDEGAQPKQAKAAKVNATSDDRTNSVIVTAPVESLKIIEQIVKDIDEQPGSGETVFIYHLRNGQAQNLETVLNTLFGNIQNGQNQNNQNNPNQQNQQNQQSPFGGNLPGGNANPGSGLNAQNRNNRYGNNNRNNRQRLQPGMAQAISDLTGQALFVAEPDTNSLIVTTAVKYRREVEAIIHELDRPAAQVLIKVLVAEVTHDNSADFGTDFSILNTRPNGNGQGFNQAFGQPGSGLTVTFLENNLNVTLHALAEQNKLDVLSRPYILASDNQEASILVGQDVPIVTSNYVTSFGNSVSNYEYRKVGIILDVTPHINPDGQVILDVAPEISQLTGQTVNVGPGSNPPVIADRSASSRVGIKDGQTIVIGGLMQDEKTLKVSKIPLLGDIPIIGIAFSRTEVDKSKTELLIFLTPHVAQMPEELKPMTEDELKGTRLTPRAVEPGIFDEHMQGLRRGNIPATQQSAPSPPVFDPESPIKPNSPPAPTSAPAPQQTVESDKTRHTDAR
jgi:type II secretion system protein D